MYYLSAIKQTEKLIKILDLIHTHSRRLEKNKSDYERILNTPKQIRWYNYPWFNQSEMAKDIGFQKKVYDRLLSYYNNELTKLSPLKTTK